MLRAKQDDSRVRSRRELSKVRKVEIESEDHAIFTLGGSAHLNVHLTEQTFFNGGRYVVTERQKPVFQMTRKIFIQFDVH
jgi:hypothetical protein